jgi:hypothetical protein
MVMTPPSYGLGWGKAIILFLSQLLRAPRPGETPKLPATCTDIFGARYATTNAGLLYTAKGAAAWVVPLTSLLKTYTGHWYLV